MMRKIRNIITALSFVLISSFFGCSNTNNVQENAFEYICDGNYHWLKGDENKKITHEFSDNVCKVCGLYYNKTLFDIFGDDTIIYKNSNPYNINLKKYGNDVSAIFYEPNFSNAYDLYADIDKESFYNDSYDISYTYEDSFYRTKHGLVSGEIKPLNHLLEKDNRLSSDTRISSATYVLDKKGKYIGYFTNSLDNISRPIWYKGAYVTQDDVCAYLLAFGEVPPNSNYKTNEKERRAAIDFWGEYARLNYAVYKCDNVTYPYEPTIPKGSYLETDYGSNDHFFCGDVEEKSYLKGNKIIRGSCRFVFTNGKSEKNIDNRHVFYTYNHYNDFEEYLNCDKGYGKRFGNESAGNEYCTENTYDRSLFNEPTSYPKLKYKKIGE